MLAVFERHTGQIARTAASFIFFCVVVHGASVRAEEPGILNLGDAVVTGFSQLTEPEVLLPPPSTDTVIDETLIDLDGTSAHIVNLSAPAYVWDARAWPAEAVRDFKARDIGQVFGAALDNSKNPNIYVAASSAYGLHLVAPDADGDGRPERLKKGGKDAKWMPGMWGGASAAGGPGSIWKIDGTTAEITLFANVLLKGKANAGAGLGNLAFDAAHQQIFVSDLSTGMIHRLGLDGKERDLYDHGVTGRSAAKLDPVAYDETAQLDITSSDFDSEEPETWGYADPRRAVWGLAVHDGRLYYAVTGESQIWSVGLDKEAGAFLQDARWEIDVPKKPKNLPVSDILFTHKGAMLLAQRGEIKSTYDYANLANPGKARVYRYWLENPDDPATLSRWIAEPEEYAVGFDGDNRQTDGGIDLNYGYTSDGYLDPTICEASLWTTGDNLRLSEPLKDALLPGGPLVIDGVQGMPAGPVKGKNTPPWASYMLDNDPVNTAAEPGSTPFNHSDEKTQGWIGDIAIYRVGCDGGGSGETAGGYWGGAGYTWSDPPYGEDCMPGLDCPPIVECTEEPDCPPPPPRACIIPRGGFVCDEAIGSWIYTLNADVLPNFNADTLKVTGITPGLSVSNGPEMGLNLAGNPLQLAGGTAGQVISLDLCVFNKLAEKSGKPFDCCKTTVTVKIPGQACEKKQ